MPTTSDLHASDITFPATCGRCGARVSEPVSFCPHCGAHARLAFRRDASQPASRATPTESAKRASAGAGVASTSERTARTASALGDALWPEFRPKPLFATGDPDPYGDVRGPSKAPSRHWGLKTGTGLVLCAFVVLYGGVVLLHSHNRDASSEQESSSRTVEGSVSVGSVAHTPSQPPATSAPSARAKSDTLAEAPAPASITPLPPIAPAAPLAPRSIAQAPAGNPSNVTAMPPEPPPAEAQAMQPTPAVSAAPAPKPAPTQAQAPTQAPNAVAADARHPHRSRTAVAQVFIPSPSPSSSHTPGAKPAPHQPGVRVPSWTTPRQDYAMRSDGRTMPAPTSVSRAMESAQASLEKNDLSAARAALASAQANESNNSEAFMLRQDLASRERARDAALNAARGCMAQERWKCAWHNAGNALSIDSSSAEAKALIERSIVDSGEAARPAGPGPDPDLPGFPAVQ